MTDGLRDRMAQAGALAGKTVPLAQTAGSSVRQVGGSARAKATPVVEAARSWAAPQLEQYAHVISDSIAPMISSALLTAAHKIEVPRRKSRPSRGVVAGAVVLTAAAGAATVAVVRMRRSSGGNGGVTVTTESVTVESEPPDADMDGHSRIV
jgi:hypothetical protein